MHTEHLIERLRTRRGDQHAIDFDIWDFIHAEGSGLDALMYSKLFWPDFVEIDGMVFLEGHTISSKDTERVREVIKKEGGDRTSTEKAFNHIEVAYLFGPRRGDTTDEEDLWLAELLSEMWSARLRSLYPGRSFVVEVLDELDKMGELYIVFFQQRP